MAERLIIHPLNRVSKPLRVELLTDGQKIVSAKAGTTFYWDFARTLAGKDPLDALQLAQRSDGTASISHVVAAARALEKIAGVKVPENTRVIRNLLLALDTVYGHIAHFYEYALPDYIPFPEAGPFYRGPGDYRISSQELDSMINNTWRAFEVRRLIQHAMAVLGGKAPHTCSVVFGGTTGIPDGAAVLKIKSLGREISHFINNEYKNDLSRVEKAYPDYFSLGASGSGLLTVGEYQQKTPRGLLIPDGVVTGTRRAGFDQRLVSLDLSGSYYEPEKQSSGSIADVLKPAPQKERGYSWVKGAIYDGRACEVGALARMTVSGSSGVKELGVRAASVMGRLRARYEEAAILADQLQDWIAAVEPGSQSVSAELPEHGEGLGAAEGSDGPVLHYISIDNALIQNYHVLDAASWNFCPGTGNGERGPLENALAGITANAANLSGILRVARSF